MRKGEKKKALFNRFEEQVAAIRTAVDERRAKVAQFVAKQQAEVDQEIANLGMFSDLIVSAVGDVSVVPPELSGKREARKPSRGRGGAPPPAPQKKRRRKRRTKTESAAPATTKPKKRVGRPPQPGSEWAAVPVHVPEAVERLAATGKEFTVRDVVDWLASQKIVVNRKYVSLYLGQQAGALGLLVDKRYDPQMASASVNFFRRAGTHPDARSGRTDWSQRVLSVLRRASDGLSEEEVLSQSLGDVPPNFRSARRQAVRRAVGRLLERGAIVKIGDVYTLA